MRHFEKVPKIEFTQAVFTKVFQIYWELLETFEYSGHNINSKPNVFLFRKELKSLFTETNLTQAQENACVENFNL